MVKRGFDDVGRQFSDAIEGLREEMATKEDLKRFATKEDLKHFATKEDLKDFATKDDMKASEVRILQAVDKIIALSPVVISTDTCLASYLPAPPSAGSRRG